MKNTDKKVQNKPKVKSGISVDKKLDKIKNVNFISNKIEEVNKVVNQLSL